MANGNVVLVVVVDANVIITLIQEGMLEVLWSIPGHRFVIPDEVVAEVKRPEQAQELRNAIDNNQLEELPVTSVEELTIFTELIKRLGRGESACIAVAEVRGWSVASDEKRRFLRTVRERLGINRLLTTSDIKDLAEKERQNIEKGEIDE